MATPLLQATPQPGINLGANNPQGVPIQANPIQIAPSSVGGISGISQPPQAQPQQQPQQQSTGNSVGDFINQARQQGVPDEQIFNYLHQNGMVPTNALVMQKGGLLNDAKDVGIGIGKGLAQVGTNVVNSVLQPIANFILGGNQKAQQFTPQQLALTNSAQKFGSFVGQTLPYLMQPELAPEAIAESAGGKALAGGFTAAEKTAFNAGGAALGAGTIAGLQGQNPLPAALTAGGISLAAPAVSSLLNKGQDLAEKSSLRLTPALEKKLGEGKIDNIVDLTSRLKVDSPEGRLTQVGNLYDDMENTLQKTLQSPELSQANTAIPKSQILSQLQEIPQQYANDPAMRPRVISAVNTAVKDLQINAPDYLSINQLNDFKRSFANNGAFSEFSGQVKDEASADIASVFRKNVEDGMNKTNTLVPVPASVQKLYPELPKELPTSQWNALYGKIIQTKDVLEVAKSRPQLNFLDRAVLRGIGGLFGLGSGGPIGGVVGEMASGSLADNFPATAIRSTLGKASAGAAKLIPKIKLPVGAAISAKVK